MRREPDQRAVEAEDRREEAVADARSIPRDRVEDALEIRGRDGDGAQDLRRGGLLIAGPPERPFCASVSRADRASARRRVRKAPATKATPTARRSRTRTPASAKRPSVRRAAASGPQARATHAARRVLERTPGSREDGVACLRTGPAATWGGLGPVLMGRSSGPGPALGQSSPAASDASEDRAIIAPGRTGV